MTPSRAARAGSLVNDNTNFARETTWYLDTGGVHHANPACASTNTTKVHASLLDVEPCENCWTRAISSSPELRRDWADVRDLVEIAINLETLEDTLEGQPSLDELAHHTHWLVDAETIIRANTSANTSCAREELTERVAQARTKHAHALTRVQDSVRDWATSDGVRNLPWADMATDNDRALFGTHDDDSGLHHIAQTWTTNLGNGSPANYSAAQTAAIQAVDELEPPQPTRKTAPAQDLDAWRADVRQRTLELVNNWATTVNAAAQTSGTLTVGLHDPRGIRKTNNIVRDVLARVPHTVNETANTIVLESDASIANILSVYCASNALIRTEIVNGRFTPEVLETATALWDPYKGDTYATLASSLNASEALAA